NNYFTFDYLFYNEKQASFKLIKTIEDISPSRFKTLIENIEKINKNTSLPFSYSIKKIYYTFLIKTGKNSQDIFYIDILDSLIHGKYINFSQVYKNFLAIYKRIYYDSFSGYNLSNYYKEAKSNSYFVRNFLNSTAFLMLAYHLNCIEREDRSMENFRDKILSILANFKEELERKIGDEKDDKKKETLNFIKNKYENIISYFELTKNTINDLHRALVLIGVLIARIAQKQSGKGHSNYPILNKINFQGMKLKDIQRLYNTICEKLKQYNLINQSSNNSLLGLISEIISAYQKEWDKTISKEENVYYIMSGFSMGILSTYKPEESEGLEDETIEEEEEELTED
ncbi:MAG: TM1802 family CRISPR-associated protein, partial [Brevinematales bacterium]